MMIYGYGMEYTWDEAKDLQMLVFKKAGADRIYIEKAFKPKDHTRFRKLLEQVKAGDTVIVWKLSRMAYSLKDLSFKLKTLLEKGVCLICHLEMFNLQADQLAVMSNLVDVQWQNDHLVGQEMTIFGLNAARARGRKGGRRKSISKVIQEKTMLAHSMLLANDGRTIKEILSVLKLSPAAYYKYKSIYYPTEKRQNIAEEK